MNDFQVARVEAAAKKLLRALKLVDQARSDLNTAGAYENDDLFLASSNLTDAMRMVSAAHTATHMTAFIAKQERRSGSRKWTLHPAQEDMVTEAKLFNIIMAPLRSRSGRYS